MVGVAGVGAGRGVYKIMQGGQGVKFQGKILISGPATI